MLLEAVFGFRDWFRIDRRERAAGQGAAPMNAAIGYI